MSYKNFTEKQLLEELLSKKNSEEEFFNKFVNHIDHDSKTQEKTAEIVEKLNEKLLDPDDGLFAKVAKLNTEVSFLAKQFEKLDLIDNEIKEIKKLADNNEDAIGIIKRAAGEDFEELRKLVDTRKSFSKLYWSLLGSIIVSIASIFYTLIKSIH